MKTIKLFLTLLFITTWCFAQNNFELRQGAYFTPEEGKAEHAKLAALYQNKEEWQSRAEEIRKGILDGAEIDNLIRNQKVNATIHSKKTFAGYTVENVFFEAFKGVYVSGNLYKPTNIKGKVPGILCPHGHGVDPRFKEYTQQRCATLARMGAVVFAYDMVGQGDMKQAEHKIRNVLKGQLITGVRSLDFLSQLPEVDASKIAMTGESGGGTQTFLLSALDDRISVSVPVVMVSSYFFGGCQCESGMPIHVREHHKTSNVEIAACFAPKPLLLISDGGDWTQHNPEVAIPHIKRIYHFFDAKQNIENVHLANEKHDYGPSKRQAAYAFLAKHLSLNTVQVLINDSFDESKNTILPSEELSVFNQEHPRPANAAMGNIALMMAIDAY
ncbi:acetylxylan esterase [uncultured Arcticibacterium sp.]|uniref:alpha/beta hydrolase family protein n=1 Tax=uncultured Arcticibacterium sp. TaxID=2173042 RepID=UPI0030FC8725